jgi:hypothetical protein
LRAVLLIRLGAGLHRGRELTARQQYLMHPTRETAMSIRLSCPSCNTSFALEALPPTHRATCPRCGDLFPVRDPTAEETEDRNQESGVRSQETEQGKERVAVPARPAPSGLSVRKAVLVAVALGVVGFAVGLVVYNTREPKPHPEPPPPPEITATPPAQLVGLGYLPAECNVVFAVQPGPLLEYAARTKQEPRALLTQAGVPDQVLSALDSIGPSLPQIDHIAGGVYLPDPGDSEMRVALVLVLKQPLANEEEFLKKLKTKPVAGKHSRWEIELNKVPLAPVLVRTSPTVWVLGLNDKDFIPVERGGFGPGGTQFRGSESDGLRKMLGSVPPEAAAWIAVDDDRDWTQKPLVKLLAAQSPEVKKGLPALSSGRGGLFALTFGEKPRMRLFVRTAEAATAEHLRAYFQARAAETESATAGGGGAFALYDGPFDSKTLERFLADLK